MASSRWKLALDVVASVAMLLATGTVIWVNVGKTSASTGRQVVTSLPSEPVSLVNAAVLGSRTARVAIIEFSDFQCPFCAQFERTTLPALKAQYIEPGSVEFVFRHLPLVEIHPFALAAATTADCARRQGKFWGLHEKFFESTGSEFSDAFILKAIEDIGLDHELLARCVRSEGASAIASDVRAAGALAIQTTPTFLVGTVQLDGLLHVTDRINGAKPLGEFKAIIDRLLK